MMIGQLASRTGLSVRTLRFYADAGVLPEAGARRRATGCSGRKQLPGPGLIRTLRELGVGLDDIKRVLAAETSLADVAAEHARALDAQISLLRLQRAALRAFARSADSEELQLMTDLTALTAGGRRRIVEDYLDAVFGDAASAVADKLRMGIPELPDDPAPEQLAAWVRASSPAARPGLRGYSSRRMAQRALAEGPAPDPAQFQVSQAIGEIAGPAARTGIAPPRLKHSPWSSAWKPLDRSRPRPVRSPPSGSKRSPTAAWDATGPS